MKDKKLSDYINNVLQEEGLAPKPKLTFDEWWAIHEGKDYSNFDGLSESLANFIWDAAQENV